MLPAASVILGIQALIKDEIFNVRYTGLGHLQG